MLIQASVQQGLKKRILNWILNFTEGLMKSEFVNHFEQIVTGVRRCY